MSVRAAQGARASRSGRSPSAPGASPTPRSRWPEANRDQPCPWRASARSSLASLICTANSSPRLAGESRSSAVLRAVGSVARSPVARLVSARSAPISRRRALQMLHERALGPAPKAAQRDAVDEARRPRHRLSAGRMLLEVIGSLLRTRPWATPISSTAASRTRLGNIGEGELEPISACTPPSF